MLEPLVGERLAKYQPECLKTFSQSELADLSNLGSCRNGLAIRWFFRR